MKHSTRDNICAAIGLFLVIVLLTTAVALDDPVVPDAPAAVTQDVTGKLPSEDTPAAGCASIELGELLGEFRVTAYTVDPGPATQCGWMGKWLLQKRLNEKEHPQMKAFFKCTLTSPYFRLTFS